MARRFRLGIDTGGTFTDVVALDLDTGEIVTTKTPSTPDDPARGFLAGIEKVGGTATAIVHGTTVATNQLLEGDFGRIGLVTTEGFEFLLEIARQSVPDGYGNSYFWVKPPRIVPADLVRTVRGRLDHTGAELRPFDDESAHRAAEQLKDVDAVGVCFLHAYANPAHERRMRAILLEHDPAAVVSISSDVLREYREYERAMTTLIDAAVKPKVAAYVRNIAGRLPAGTPFHIMKSNGGILSADEVVNQPISTVLSGPAAGALGAGLVASKAGYEKVLTLDGGGTSTDVAVVLAGVPALTTEGSVGAYPSKIPMIDVVTVGAGGGSVAWLSPEGTLKVGPRSAGADPGPMCYPDGGGEPTVTDAHLVLGRIPPHLLGGEVPLEARKARDGVAELGARLGLGTVETAAGILEISAWNQANALRQITVKRGLDVRDFTLVTFGGSGSLLACRLLDILGLGAVLVPRDPGNLSAFGLLTVDVRNDYVRTFVARDDRLDVTAAHRVLAGLTTQAAGALTAEGFPPDEHRFERTADLRYFGQAYEVRVDLPDGAFDRSLADRVRDAFHAAHQQLYGYSFAGRPEQPVEWVNLRVTGVGPIEAPSLRTVPSSTGAVRESGRRAVCFDRTYEETPTYERPDLRAGDVVRGPAVIEEYGSTIPVHPGFTARTDVYGNLVISR